MAEIKYLGQPLDTNEDNRFTETIDDIVGGRRSMGLYQPFTATELFDRMTPEALAALRGVDISKLPQTLSGAVMDNTYIHNANNDGNIPDVPLMPQQKGNFEVHGDKWQATSPTGAPYFTDKNTRNDNEIDLMRILNGIVAQQNDAKLLW